MNWLDIVIIVVAALFGLSGLWRGAIRTAFGIAGLVVGIVLAGFLMARFPLLLALLPKEFDFIRDFFSHSGRIY